MSDRLTDVMVGYGLDDVTVLEQEVDQMWDTILGRRDAPELPNSPHLALQEIATAYLGRALEMDTKILRAERNGAVQRGSQLQKFRTGDLANLIVLCRKAADLGSRRLTEIGMIHAESTRSSW